MKSRSDNIMMEGSYTPKNQKPESKFILGRTRLRSLEDSASLTGSDCSMELPLEALTLKDIADEETDDRVSYVKTRCVCEHEDIGFSPLSHTICSDDEESNSDFETDYNFEDNINPFVQNELPDSAKVCVYWQKCEKNKLELFNGNASVNQIIDQIQTEMRGLREVRKTLH